MSIRQIQQNKREILIHDFEKGLDHTLKAIERELSERNIDLIKRYDKEMVRRSLARGTRLKHLLIILSLSRILKKDWEDVTKSVIGGSDNSIVTTINVGTSPIGVAVNPTTNTIYVADNEDNIVYVIGEENIAPDCLSSSPSVDIISKANQKLVDISISGVTDANGDSISITITGITQDETTSELKGNDKSPDGFGIGTDTAQIRAQKDSQGNGRVYEISFEADDGNGGMCNDSVNVVVPKNKKTVPVDDGQSFDSTIP